VRRGHKQQIDARELRPGKRLQWIAAVAGDVRIEVGEIRRAVFFVTPQQQRLAQPQMPGERRVNSKPA